VFRWNRHEHLTEATHVQMQLQRKNHLALRGGKMRGCTLTSFCFSRCQSPGRGVVASFTFPATCVFYPSTAFTYHPLQPAFSLFLCIAFTFFIFADVALLF
jgi:hypothetical protein